MFIALNINFALTVDTPVNKSNVARLNNVHYSVLPIVKVVI